MNDSNSLRFRWGVELTPDSPPDDVGALAKRAEDAGFDAAFVSSHYNNRDPFVTLSSVAAATETMELGPGVANPYDGHPVRLAARAATLDERSGGRAVLGLGAGDRSTLAHLGIERDQPLRRVLETIDVARRLWAGDRVSHHGTFAVEDASLSFPTRRLPILVGGQGPHMLRMAGKHADGVLVNAAHPDDYAWATDQLAIGRTERSSALEPPKVAAFASVSVAEEAAAARAAARTPVAFIVGGAAQSVLERHDVDIGVAADISAALSAGDHARAIDLVTPEMLEAFTVAGTPADVTGRIEQLFESVDAFVAAAPLGPDRSTAIELLGEIRSSLEGVPPP